MGYFRRDSPKATIYSLWVKDTDLSDSDIGTYIALILDLTGIWDYYVGMYKDLMTYNSSSKFLNAMNLIEDETTLNITFQHKDWILQADGLYIPSSEDIQTK